MKQNNQKEDCRDFLKNIGFGLLVISVQFISDIMV